MKKIASKEFWKSEWTLPGAIAGLNLLLHLLAIKGFGYFIDEFYYFSCSDHLAFGYVDQPPLSILLLKLVRLTLGDSRFALRLLPAIGSALFIVLCALLARELGGRKLAMTLTAAAAFAPTINFFMYHIFSMNFLDQLFWLALLLIFLRILKTDNGKPWLLFGLMAGLGMQNKLSVLFLCFGIAAGLLLTRERRQLLTPQPWLAVGLALLIFLPYVFWNLAHGWPTLEWMHNVSAYKNTAVSPFEFLIQQILINNPLTLFLWLPGLFFLFFHQRGKKYRPLGWAYLAIYVLYNFIHAKNYYLAAFYPLLFAAAAVMWEEKRLQSQKKAFPMYLAAATLTLAGLLTSPITLPIFTATSTVKIIQASGINTLHYENDRMGPLPQYFADMFGWEELTTKVAGVYQRLALEEKKKCIIYAQNYGEAGAINFLGKKYGLPMAYSGHNNHYFWPPPMSDAAAGPGSGVVIVVGGRMSDHLRGFATVVEAGRTSCRWCMPRENDLPIWICRGLKKSLKEIWPTVKFFI